MGVNGARPPSIQIHTALLQAVCHALQDLIVNSELLDASARLDAVAPATPTVLHVLREHTKAPQAQPRATSVFWVKPRLSVPLLLVHVCVKQGTGLPHAQSALQTLINLVLARLLVWCALEINMSLTTPHSAFRVPQISCSPPYSGCVAVGLDMVAKNVSNAVRGFTKQISGLQNASNVHPTNISQMTP